MKTVFKKTIFLYDTEINVVWDENGEKKKYTISSNLDDWIRFFKLYKTNFKIALLLNSRNEHEEIRELCVVLLTLNKLNVFNIIDKTSN